MLSAQLRSAFSPMRLDDCNWRATSPARSSNARQWLECAPMGHVTLHFVTGVATIGSRGALALLGAPARAILRRLPMNGTGWLVNPVAAAGLAIAREFGIVILGHTSRTSTFRAGCSGGLGQQDAAWPRSESRHAAAAQTGAAKRLVICNPRGGQPVVVPLPGRCVIG
jgi:hypothetical protein